MVTSLDRRVQKMSRAVIGRFRRPGSTTMCLYVDGKYYYYIILYYINIIYYTILYRYIITYADVCYNMCYLGLLNNKCVTTCVNEHLSIYDHMYIYIYSVIICLCTVPL